MFARWLTLLSLGMAGACGGSGNCPEQAPAPAAQPEEPKPEKDSTDVSGEEAPPLGNVKTKWTHIEGYRYGDFTPCLGGGNVLFFDGDIDDFIHPGQARIDEASYEQLKNSKFPHTANLQIQPAGIEYGSSWSLTFSSKQLDRRLEEREYENAERLRYESDQRPGLSITGDGRACSKLGGKFKIREIEWKGTHLKKLTAAFVQYCERRETELRGCVHYEAPLAP